MSEIRIVGGTPMGEGNQPKILDSRSKTEQPKPEIRVHEEVVTTDDKVRKEARKPGDPEVRVRLDGGTFDAALADDDD